MGVFDMVFGMIYNILSVYAGIRVIELFLVPKSRNRNISIPLYIGTWLVNSVVYYVSDSGIGLTRLSIFLCFAVLVIFLYEGNWKRKVLAVISAMGLGIIVENIVWIFSNALGVSDGECRFGMFMLRGIGIVHCCSDREAAFF